MTHRLAPAADVCADLNALVAVGTLTVYDLPQNIALLGLLAPDSWNWLDLNFLTWSMDSPLHPLIQDLHTLIRGRFVSATFVVVPVQIGPISLTLARIRVYAVPADTGGARTVAAVRSHKLDRAHGAAWDTVAAALDFSPDAWDEAPRDFTSLLQNPILLIPATDSGPSSIGPVNLHFDRWKLNAPYVPPPTQRPQSPAARLQHIYNSIQSPDFAPAAKQPAGSDVSSSIPTPTETLRRLLRELAVDGVSSTLYPFQAKSVAKMYEKELSVSRSLVPSLIEFTSADKNRPFYYHITKKSILLLPEYYTLPRGGILAENMGLGKSLICLSLICLTKFEVSTIPQDLLLYHEEDDDVLMLLPDQLREMNTRKSVKSLSEFCRNTINQNSLPWKFFIDDLPKSVVSLLHSTPGSFKVRLSGGTLTKVSNTRSPIKNRRGPLNAEGTVYRTLYLCNTTLVITPDNLFHQWIGELKKHIDAKHLRKLYISRSIKYQSQDENETFTKDPPVHPQELISYDLVIINATLFSKIMTEPECAFLRVYWKRFIIDEGHSMGASSSKISDFCRLIYAERRWAVTGTPTSGLTRLHMDEDPDEVSSKRNKYTVQQEFNEKSDLVRLGNIVANFLQIEPFFSSRKMWNNMLVKPFLSGVYDSSVSLSNLLNAIMVRHASIDTDVDIKLPQLHHKAVFLEPSFHNKISINLFTAVLAVNAVSSERTDIDYMFHPNNRQQLRRLVTNLQRATFHWTGFQQEDVEALVHVCLHSFKKRKANGKSVYSNEDLQLLEKSLAAAKFALVNSRWRIATVLHEMNYYITGLPDAFTKSFGTGVLESTNNIGEHDDISVFGAPHIHTMQEFFFKNRFLDMSDATKLTEKLEAVLRPFWKTYWDDTMKRNSEKFNKQDANQNVNSAMKAEQLSDALGMKQDKTDHNPATSLSRSRGDGITETDTVHTGISEDMSYEKLKEATLLGTASSKLSYLASRLLEHQQDNIKSIVFFEFEDSAYYLTELLDILGINYILYATFIKGADRAKNLADFSHHQSADGGIALIMDLRLAAHGLTIISATRVYFVSPVWQRSVEAQAIKRAHRIGQTQEVHVETLVLKGTLEEEIYKKRTNEAVKDDKPEKNKYVIDDMGMQNFILKHQFLPIDHNEPEYCTFEAPTESSKTFNEETPTFSLPGHSDYVTNMKRHWNMKVFSNASLTKKNAIKAKKLIDSVTNPFEEPRPEVKVEKREPQRKKVRF